MRKRYVAIIGATASGKSALALRLAEAMDGELINCDSVQIYRGFDMGSAKPSAEELSRVRHHLIDVRQSHEDFDARHFAALAGDAIAEIRGRGKLPILVGGTGLYLKALWQDGFHDLPKSIELRSELQKLSIDELHTRLRRIDPKRAEEIHGNDRYRLQRAVEIATLLGHSVKDLPPPESTRDEAFVVGLQCERKILQERIARRSQLMLDQGLVDEVRMLLAAGVSPDAKPMQSIGYFEAMKFLRGELSEGELLEAIIIATRQYAKRQETLFRKIRLDFIWNEDVSFSRLTDEIASWTRKMS